MSTRRILILLPIIVTLILLQSYFWVPTYEQQTKGNPHRLEDFITGSIGDASILNPILSSDTASTEVENLVFEGLLDRDEDLKLRGRLATSWEITEEAFFHVNEPAAIPGIGRATGDELVAFLKKKLPRSWDHVTGISVLPPRQFQITRREPAGTKGEDPRDISLTVTAPTSIKLTLNRVDQDLFKNLSAILGPDYFDTFSATAHLRAEPAVSPELMAKWAAELIPATTHNPIILFHLRPDVAFHDGHLLDAGDVKFTYEAIMDPRNLSPRVADYEPVKAVAVVDPLTVKIVYKRLYSPALTRWGMGVLPEHLLNDMALKAEAVASGKDPAKFTMRNSRFNRNPVGCGPFTFGEWKSDQYIALNRFEGYWEGPPNYKRYIMRIIPDMLTQEMEFYAGTIDNYTVLPHQVARLGKDDRYQNYSGVSHSYAYIAYNLRREPFKDPRVRRALGMAIDIDKIIKYVLHGQGEHLSGPFLKQTDYYDHEVKPLPYDPAGALALLESAGWRKNARGWLEKDGKPLRFTLITNNGNDVRRAVMAIAQDAWKRIGIEVRTDLLEWSVFLEKRVNKLDFDALILGWTIPIDPDLFQLWHSSQTNPYQLNFTGYQDPRADDLIIKIRQEYNRERRISFCHELHRLIAAAQPYTFLYTGKWTHILDKRIVIQETDPDGNVVYKPITPTKTGAYSFHLNRWVKLLDPPQFTTDG